MTCQMHIEAPLDPCTITLHEGYGFSQHKGEKVTDRFIKSMTGTTSSPTGHWLESLQLKQGKFCPIPRFLLKAQTMPTNSDCSQK